MSTSKKIVNEIFIIDFKLYQYSTILWSMQEKIPIFRGVGRFLQALQGEKGRKRILSEGVKQWFFCMNMRFSCDGKQCSKTSKGCINSITLQAKK